MTILINDNFLVGVLGIFQDAEGRILLLNHDRYRRSNPWGLPGGWTQAGETMENAIVREIREETGLTARVDGLFHMITGFRYPRIEFFFHGFLEPGEISLDEEITSYKWITQSDDRSMLCSRHRKVLDLYFQGNSEKVESSLEELGGEEPM